MPETVSQERIDELRSGLTEKLGELHRRAVHTRRVLSPSTYLNSPWLKVGIAAAIGLAIGSRRARHVLPAGAAGMPVAEPAHESVLHAIVRAGLSAATAAIVTKLLTDDDEEESEGEGEGEAADETEDDEADADAASDAQG